MVRFEVLDFELRAENAVGAIASAEWLAKEAGYRLAGGSAAERCRDVVHEHTGQAMYTVRVGVWMAARDAVAR